MKVLLEIKDNKAAFILELLSNFKFVKARALTPAKAEALEGLKDAVEQVNLDEEGKIKLQPARQLLDEL